jgi:hypothetical protein
LQHVLRPNDEVIQIFLLSGCQQGADEQAIAKENRESSDGQQPDKSVRKITLKYFILTISLITSTTVHVTDRSSAGQRIRVSEKLPAKQTSSQLCVAAEIAAKYVSICVRVYIDSIALG